MSKKPAALSASLVAVKGAAAPAPDMPSRGTSVPAAAPIASIDQDVSRADPNRAPNREGEGGLSPLNFRVPAGFRREFKTYAAQHDLKLNELLRRAFEAYRRQHDN
jgi:hypothetical protein